MGHDVFISYSHRDKNVADAACARLEQAGFRCWIAPRDIIGGEWGKAIVEGIHGARIFVLIFSGHANRSPQVNREVERAVNGGLPIIPIRIENITPSDSLEYFISNQHWLDALTPPIERHLDELAAKVGALLGSAPTRAPHPSPAPRPRRRAWPWIAGGAVAAALLAIILYLEILAPGRAGESAAAGTPLIDLAAVPTDRAPGNRVAAPPYLHEAAIPVSVVDVRPTGSVLVIQNNLAAYEGNAVRPTTSQNVLTLDVPEVVPSSFTLEFAEPVAAFSFTVPALFPASRHGVIAPAFTATALGPSGERLGRVGRPLLPTYVAVPPQSFTLRGNGRGIARIRFDSDPEGEAAFRAVLIEGMAFEPMAGR